MRFPIIPVILLAACCNTLSAAEEYAVDSYFMGNYWTPYPPGCITLPLRQLDLYGENVAMVFDEVLQLDIPRNAKNTNPSDWYAPVRTRIYRVACAEPNRSAILVEFSLVRDADLAFASQIAVPDLYGGLPMHSYPFQLKPEPNLHGQTVKNQALTHRTFGDYTGGWGDAGSFTWRFVLDGNPMGSFWGGWDVDYYNSSFDLFIYRDSGQGQSEHLLKMPATEDVLSANARLPLNGRLSGNWIEHGTTDQGFLLSISTPVPPTVSSDHPENAELLVFLAWYTFAPNGEMLWLTASALAPQGSDSVELEFVRVADGQFMGTRSASRTVAGSGRLQARNCDNLLLDYDLSALGLGRGRLEMSRVFALEIAGYYCRDQTARRDSLFGQGGN